MTSRRWLAAVVLLGTCGAGIWWLTGPVTIPEPVNTGLPPPPESTRPLTLTSSSDCRSCHAQVFEEWSGSHHAIAYVNPEVQRLSKNFRDRDCLPCHASRPVFETGLGNRVLERATRLEEGVDCFTCHQHKTAIIGGTHLSGASTAPCNPMPYAGITELGLCSPCHDQHKVIQDWKQTAFAVPGPGFKDCKGCHMPDVDRPANGDRPAYKGRSHLFPAGHDVATLKKAARYDVKLVGPREISIEVLNDGTGHNFPSDERHRAVDLEFWGESGDGTLANGRIDRFRNPYRDDFHLKNPLREPGAKRSYGVDVGSIGTLDVEAERVPAAFNPTRPVFYPENTQIPAGEARRYRVRIPKELRRATVRVYYRRQPFQPDSESVLLFEQSFDLK